MKLVCFPALHTGRLYPQQILATLGIFYLFIVSSILYKYIHTSLLSGPYICICTLALSYLFVYFSCSYMTVGEGTSVVNVALFGYVCTFSHCCFCSPFVFWCQRLFTHGRFTVACLGPSGSLPLAFSDVNFGIISTLIFLKNPSALLGSVIGVFLL